MPALKKPNQYQQNMSGVWRRIRLLQVANRFTMRFECGKATAQGLVALELLYTLLSSCGAAPFKTQPPTQKHWAQLVLTSVRICDDKAADGGILHQRRFEHQTFSVCWFERSGLVLYCVFPGIRMF